MQGPFNLRHTPVSAKQGKETSRRAPRVRGGAVKNVLFVYRFDTENLASVAFLPSPP